MHWRRVVVALGGLALGAVPVLAQTIAPGTYPARITKNPNGSYTWEIQGVASPTLYAIDLAKTGNGTCTIGPAGVFESGAVVPLSVAPAAGSTFTGWSGDADCTDGFLTMTASRRCIATCTSP